MRARELASEVNPLVAALIKKPVRLGGGASDCISSRPPFTFSDTEEAQVFCSALLRLLSTHGVMSWRAPPAAGAPGMFHAGQASGRIYEYNAIALLPLLDLMALDSMFKSMSLLSLDLVRLNQTLRITIHNTNTLTLPTEQFYPTHLSPTNNRTESIVYPSKSPPLSSRFSAAGP